MNTYQLEKSSKANKRFVLKGNNQQIHFGLKNPKVGTFIDHNNEEIKKNYIKRHSKNEDWNKINAGSLSRFILWNKPNIKQAIKDYEKKFNIKIKVK